MIIVHLHPPPCCIINMNSVHSTMVPIQAASMDPNTSQQAVVSPRSVQRRQNHGITKVELTVIPPELLVNSKSGIEASPSEECR